MLNIYFLKEIKHFGHYCNFVSAKDHEELSQSRIYPDTSLSI